MNTDKADADRSVSNSAGRGVRTLHESAPFRSVSICIHTTSKQKPHCRSGSGVGQILVINLEPDCRAAQQQRSQSESKVQVRHHELKLGPVPGLRQILLQAGRWRASATMRSRVGVMNLVAKDVNPWTNGQPMECPRFHERGYDVPVPGENARKPRFAP